MTEKPSSMEKAHWPRPAAHLGTSVSAYNLREVLRMDLGTITQRQWPLLGNTGHHPVYSRSYNPFPAQSTWKLLRTSLRLQQAWQCERAVANLSEVPLVLAAHLLRFDQILPGGAQILLQLGDAGSQRRDALFGLDHFEILLLQELLQLHHPPCLIVRVDGAVGEPLQGSREGGGCRAALKHGLALPAATQWGNTALQGARAVVGHGDVGSGTPCQQSPLIRDVASHW